MDNETKQLILSKIESMERELNKLIAILNQNKNENE